MRIISGRLKGRTIRPPRNLPVRPTTDMAKEGLFNILNNRFDFEGLRTLDLFCGTGNISLELLSRGVEHITCVDAHAGCAQFVKQSLDEYGCERSNVVRADALQFLARTTGQWDIIFADPPFENDVHTSLVELILHRNLLAEDGLLIIEHPSTIDLSALKGFEQTRKYGRLHFSFFGSEA